MRSSIFKGRVLPSAGLQLCFHTSVGICSTAGQLDMLDITWHILDWLHRITQLHSREPGLPTLPLCVGIAHDARYLCMRWGGLGSAANEP